MAARPHPVPMDRDPLRQVGAGLSQRERGRGSDVAVPRSCLEGIVSVLQGIRSDVDGAADQGPPGGWIAPDGPLLVNEAAAS